MNWIFPLLVCVSLYAFAAYYIRTRNLWEDHITFYGPLMAVRTERVAFFDKFSRLRTFFRIYGTIGVLAVIIVSIFITVMLFVSVRYTLLVRPEPTGIYEPQNILLLPGINEYVPSTLAVWLALFITIAVHEFGHGILCRVENIRVKSMGVLLAVIPIGFFVEPDEEELEKTRGIPKVRMFGGGIINNLVVGFTCFIVLLLLVGSVVPVTQPVIHGLYTGYPAEQAGIVPGSVITALNGIPVATRDEIAMALNATEPGDTVTVTVEKDRVVKEHKITLAEWPKENPGRTSGFMGVEYYDGMVIKTAIQSMLSPIGIFQFLSIPFANDTGGHFLRILAFDTSDTQFYGAPFAGFWGVVHLLFWCAWININVGVFNAIPMMPLDGGYIFKEGVDRLLERRGLLKYSVRIVSGVSFVMLIMLMSLILLPYLLHL